MGRILVRSGKDPWTVLTPEAALARHGNGVFGSNIGNLLFQLAAFRTVSAPGVAAVSDSLLLEQGKADDAFIDRVNAECQHYVIPLANAFRPTFLRPLRRLTSVIEKLEIPVTVLGIGAQFAPGRTVSALPEEVDDAARAFVSAVLERSASIGVRGAVTRDYLRHLGFGDGSIDVIGCPSLFLHGDRLTVGASGAALTAESRVAINITPSARRMAPLIEQATRRYPNLVYIPQEHTDLAMMMWREERSQPQDWRIPTHLEHRLYRENRMRSFVDAPTWLDYLRGADFAFGSRVHGNIAALLSGVPAVIVAHDSRTTELAEYHAIPYRPIADIDETTTVDELYRGADYGPFHRRHSETFATYTRFLDRNGVPHAFAPDTADGATAFDTRLAETHFPPPIEVGGAGDREGQVIYDRLRWLRQGAGTDRERTVGAYRPPFAPEPPAAPPTVAELSARVDRLAAEVASLGGGPTRRPVWRSVRRVLRGVRRRLPTRRRR